MKLYLAGLSSGYEPEHVARLFWPALQLVKEYPAHGQDAIVLHKSGNRVLCAVRWEKEITARRFSLTDGADKKQEEYEICRELFCMLRQRTGKQPPWGMLTCLLYTSLPASNC